jgi:hypothetical protein
MNPKYLNFLLPIALPGLAKLIEYFNNLYFQANKEELTIVTPIQNGFNYDYIRPISDEFMFSISLALLLIPLFYSVYLTCKTNSLSLSRFYFAGWILTLSIMVITAPDYKELNALIAVMMLAIAFVTHFIALGITKLVIKCKTNKY